jgi:hypothetical protein
MPTMVKLRAPTDTGSVNVGGREMKIEDGQVEVTQEQAAVLRESHGFIDPSEGPRAPASGSADPNRVSLSRAVVIAALKNLGIIVADKIPDDKIEQALTEAAGRQGERVAFEIAAAEARGEKAGEEKAVAALNRAEGAALDDLKKAAAAPGAPATGAPKSA